MNLSEQVLSRDFHMKGRHLVEASAGTGKTFSIETLYLRLVLLEGLTVQEILVVTFTRAATKELRQRLQKILRTAFDVLQNRTECDANDRITRLVECAREASGASDEKLLARLRQALLDFDLASIHTIHGFCKQTLERFAFSTGQLFDVEPLEGSADEIHALCHDWWRKHVYRMPPTEFQFHSKNGFSLDTLKALVVKKVSKPDAQLVYAGLSLEAAQDELKTACNKFFHDHPKTEAEELDWSSAETYPEAVQALGRIQEWIATVRKLNAEEDQLYTMLTIFQQLLSFSVTVETKVPEAIRTLAETCQAFRVFCEEGQEKGGYKRIMKSAFRIQGETLYHKNLPPEDFDNICSRLREHVQAASRSFAELDKLFEPLTIINTTDKAKEMAATWADLLAYTADPGSVDASTVFSAIDKSRNLADIFLKKKVTISLSELNPVWIKLNDDVLSRSIHPFIETAAQEIAEHYAQTQVYRTTATFNDYLLNLRTALEKEETDGPLHAVLRNTFKAALIDEFQDTDPIQWGIFDQIFNQQSEVPCFLVGDPKQAIYRFRNGDIKTYLKAKMSVDDNETHRHQLAKNYRAEKRVIDGINQIFNDPEKTVFQEEGIGYERLEVQGKKPREQLTVKGEPDPKPVKIWRIESKRNEVPGKESPEAKQAYALTADGICEILNDPDTLIAGKRVQPSQIAVLIHRHDEATEIAAELKERGVPCVRQGTGSVWQTDEAKYFWMHLKSVLQPQDVDHLRATLLAPWIALSHDAIIQLNEGDAVALPTSDQGEAWTLADWVVYFEDLRDTWFTRGFAAMYRQLTASLKLRERLVARPDGQGVRSLADIAHLSELIQTGIVKQRKSPEGVLAWIERQIGQSGEKGEGEKIRMESDDNAVRIMTVFGSKGLEFPIVFAPTLFMLKSLDDQYKKVFEFHEAQTEHEGTEHEEEVDVLYVTQDKAKGTGPEKKEEHIEHIRHIYVALTRAAHRVVVFAMEEGAGKADSVLEELLNRHDWSTDDLERPGLGPNAVEVRDVDDLPGRCEFDVKSPIQGVCEVDALLDQAPVRPKPEKVLRDGSYSSLSSNLHASLEGVKEAPQANEDGKDHDEGTGEAEALEVVDEFSPEGIFAFPAGKKTGTCWHAIFEDIDFDADESTIAQVVRQKLTAFGFLRNPNHAAERSRVVGKMVENVLKQTLPSPDSKLNVAPFALKDIPTNQQKPEWEFYFPALPDQMTSWLKAAIETEEPYKEFTARLGKWDREIPGGYMTGSVDLLFRHNDRYYIVDWKSNRRGGKQEDFDEQGVRNEMIERHYWLQYLIYTVAVHNYLQSIVPEYDYDTHFGGVYYLFLRGMKGEGSDGVYADRPPKVLIERLSAILGDFK